MIIKKIIKGRLPYERRQQLVGLAFITPWIIGCVYMFLIPLIKSLVYSIGDVKVSIGTLEWEFSGFSNYTNAFVADPEVLPALVSTITGLFYQVPIIIIFSLFIAVLLNKNFAGRMFIRAIFFLPVIIASGVVLGLIESDVMSDMLMSGSKGSMMVQSTQLSNMLLNFGLAPDLVNTLSSFVSNIFQLAWKSGIQILLFLAGLQTIPGQIYEVASIEGATAWESFWKITIPMLSPITILVFVYTVIDGFTDYSNQYIKLLLEYIMNMQISYSSALAWIYFGIIGCILGLSGIIWKVRSRKV